MRTAQGEVGRGGRGAGEPSRSVYGDRSVFPRLVVHPTGASNRDVLGFSEGRRARGVAKARLGACLRAKGYSHASRTCS